MIIIRPCGIFPLFPIAYLIGFIASVIDPWVGWEWGRLLPPICSCICRFVFASHCHHALRAAILFVFLLYNKSHTPLLNTALFVLKFAQTKTKQPPPFDVKPSPAPCLPAPDIRQERWPHLFMGSTLSCLLVGHRALPCFPLPQAHSTHPPTTPDTGGKA